MKLNETPAVLGDLLAMIEQANKQHCYGMIALMFESADPEAAVLN